MKEKVKSILENLVKVNTEVIKDKSFENIASDLIKNNPVVYDFSGSERNLFYKEDLELLEESKKDEKLNKLFESAKEKLNSDIQIINGFKKDIRNSLETIRNHVKSENSGCENQIIFLIHDYEPNACFCGFGKGNYPILESPEYFEYNYHDELFNGIGNIEYGDFWEKNIKLNEPLYKSNLINSLVYSDIYIGLQNAYKFKTNLLLYEAFDQIPIEEFEGISIQTPLFIYRNEHDCKPMNVYIYE